MTVSKLVGRQNGWFMMVLMMVGHTEAADIQLAWDPPPAQVAGYRLYYGQSSGDYSMVVDVGSQTTYTVTDLDGAQGYYFNVTAYDDWGNESPLANEVSTLTTSTNADPSEPMSAKGLEQAGGSSELQEAMHRPLPPPDDGGQFAETTSMSAMIGGGGESESTNGGMHRDLWQWATHNPRKSALDTTAQQLISEQIEIGETQVGQQWQRVELRKTFADPVVVAKATRDPQADPTPLRIRGIDTTGFEMRLEPWDDDDRSQIETLESVGYLVIERGGYTLGEGILIEAGVVEAGSTDVLNRISFGQRFSATPVVITAVVGGNEGDVVSGRPTRVGRDGFGYRLQTSSDNQAMDIPVSLAYVAWEPSWGAIDGLTFEVKRSHPIALGSPHMISFKEIFVGVPVFLADLQGPADRNILGLWWHNISLEGVPVMIDLDHVARMAAPDIAPVVGHIAIRETGRN
jgi:hypothetical protein